MSYFEKEKIMNSHTSSVYTLNTKGTDVKFSSNKKNIIIALYFILIIVFVVRGLSHQYLICKVVFR